MKADVATLTPSALGVLMPLPDQEIDAGYLAGFTRRMDNALDADTEGNLANWAWAAWNTFWRTYPRVPSEEKVAELFPELFSVPPSPWKDVRVVNLGVVTHRRPSTQRLDYRSMDHCGTHDDDNRCPCAAE